LEQPLPDGHASATAQPTTTDRIGRLGDHIRTVVATGLGNRRRSAAPGRPPHRATHRTAAPPTAPPPRRTAAPPAAPAFP